MELEARKGKGKKRKADELTPKKGAGTGSKFNLAAQKKLVKKKPRITSQGNKRMSIPDELIPEFCRRIGAGGTAERMKVINKFVEDYPDVSVRQVTFKFSEVTTKDCPPGITPPEKKSGRAFQFYLRPRLYIHLPVEERPQDWERLMEEDEILWKKEEEERMKRDTEKANKLAEMASKSATSSKAPSPVPSEARSDVVEAVALPVGEN
jgi:hypothetical protein